ncbi:hypothetical protein U9M48_035432 [Paspalum notatum var. saurae]|uniref:Uncharacterized protein n=1 Tax=Paspalum notatum var. saurae TaxID=547442 RepID=A0AAQ3UBM0_PASNO
MDRSLIGGRPHQTLKPYTKLAVGYAMAELLSTTVHRWGLGDGALEYNRIPRPQRTSQGSSSRRLSRAQQEAQQEETRRLQEKTRKLRENNDYMMTYLMTLSQKFGGDVPEFRPLQPYQQDHRLEMLQSFDLHLTTIALLPAKDHHVEMLRASQPQQWMYPTQGPPFGDASQSQPPQWMHHPMMMYRGQQPMFYPGSQPPYYMPWRTQGRL